MSALSGRHARTIAQYGSQCIAGETCVFACALLSCRSAGVAEGAAAAVASAKQQRRFSVMRNSWPSLRPPPDPTRPSVARIVKQMDSSRTQEARVAKGDAESRTLPRHLPETYLPSPAATPAASAVGRGRAGAGAVVRGNLIGGAGSAGEQWRPPGWDAFSQHHAPRAGALPAPPRRRKKPIESERPIVEVWGMRAGVVLFFAIAGLHIRDYTVGPNGIWKPMPRIRGPDED
eukprot:CAMPEP_0117579012 /NCGR_PEP_ID=MMETSP0784-20121206/64363_1 /TAXON_ID=39447 /ORGANISM="" /LENGTH=231 /DNA_ID=CAMNT_0005378821 /DNA_START=130 /DNA_END=822 /DNA_ORIENTATION=+